MISELVTVKREVLEQVLEALEKPRSQQSWYQRSIDDTKAATALRAALEQPVSKDRIREIFMAAGFTIKEGQTDLKPYVYEAAYALLNEAAQPAQQPGGAS